MIDLPITKLTDLRTALDEVQGKWQEAMKLLYDMGMTITTLSQKVGEAEFMLTILAQKAAEAAVTEKKATSDLIGLADGTYVTQEWLLKELVKFKKQAQEKEKKPRIINNPVQVYFKALPFGARFVHDGLWYEKRDEVWAYELEDGNLGPQTGMGEQYSCLISRDQFARYELSEDTSSGAVLSANNLPTQS